MAEEEKKPKPLLQVMEENQQALNQFMFVMFIPNPNNHTVKLWIDDGNIQTVMRTEQFLDTIQKICGYDEYRKLSVACMEYGTPFLYDRSKARLNQISEDEAGRNLHISAGYHREYEENKSMSDFNTRYNSTLDDYERLLNFGIPKDVFNTKKDTSDQREKN